MAAPLLLALISAIASCRAASAQAFPPADDDSPRVVEAVRLGEEETIRLDGRLSEPAWRSATPATRFRQQEPAEGAPPTERTEVRILYDAEALYLGVMAYDENPDGVIAHQRRRDARLGTDDRFRWVLDTFLDGRTGYFFEVNPAGLMSDALLTAGPGGSLNRSWDGIWEARVARRPDGWSIEVKIPFRTLDFDPALEEWGIDFQRTIRRKGEEALWSAYRRNQGLFRPIHAGRLTGLRGLSQGVGLEASPYLAAVWRRDGDRNGPERPDVGLDLSYSFTPSLRAALTVNTDFAEAEVDQRRVNLTRFPLFFPEQRDFFLEGSGVYDFAPANGVTPYFSRRIGLVDGERVPLRWGTRLGGTAGPHQIGFLQVRTGNRGDWPAEDFTVARLVRTLFGESTLGAIYTRRATGEQPGADPGETDPDWAAPDPGASLSPPDRHTAGADLELATTRFLGRQNLRFQAFLVWHSDSVSAGTPEAARTTFGDRTARGLRLTYPNDPLRAHVSYRELGDAFDPAVGFTSRNGFRRLQPSVAISPRPGWRAVRELEFEVSFQYLTDLSGTLLTRSLGLTLPGIRFESDDRVEIEISRRLERLEQPFTIHPDITLPEGVYRMDEVELSARSASHRRLAAEASISTGEFWSGTRRRAELEFEARPYTGVNLAAELERNDVRLDEGRFTTHLVRGVGEWSPTPRLALIGNIQYDDISEILGLNARLRWIPRPGTNIWMVYTHNWASGEPGNGRGLHTLSQEATTKVDYTHRF